MFSDPGRIDNNILQREASTFCDNVGRRKLQTYVKELKSEHFLCAFQKVVRVFTILPAAFDLCVTYFPMEASPSDGALYQRWWKVRTLPARTQSLHNARPRECVISLLGA